MASVTTPTSTTVSPQPGLQYGRHCRDHFFESSGIALGNWEDHDIAEGIAVDETVTGEGLVRLLEMNAARLSAETIVRARHTSLTQGIHHAKGRGWFRIMC